MLNMEIANKNIKSIADEEVWVDQRCQCKFNGEPFSAQYKSATVYIVDPGASKAEGNSLNAYVALIISELAMRRWTYQEAMLAKEIKAMQQQ